MKNDNIFKKRKFFKKHLKKSCGGGIMIRDIFLVFDCCFFLIGRMGGSV